MPNIPTPLRAALGLAATALDEARKLPETLPQVPVVAITTAMQASLRVQQHIAALAARGDEVISQLRGTSSEPPTWATFDDLPAEVDVPPNGRVAAFDRVGQTEPDQAPAGEPEVTAAGPDANAPSAAAAAAAAPVAGSAKRAVAKPAVASKPTGPAKRAKPAKSTRPPKTAGPAGSPAPAPSDEPHQPASEPLRRAASRARAKPTGQPNPVTMAAEIVQAHDADQADQAGGAEGGPALGEAGSEQE